MVEPHFCFCRCEYLIPGDITTRQRATIEHGIERKISVEIAKANHRFVERQDGPGILMTHAPQALHVPVRGEIRLRHSYVMRCDEAVKDASGKVTELRCSIDHDTLGKNPVGRKVKGVIHWLAREQPAGALERINRTLRQCRRTVIALLPQITESARRKSVGDIFSPRFLKTTVIIAITYFLHITTYYFILKWVPKIVADMGFAVSSAGNVLVWANVGGALGGTIFGFLTLKFDLKKLSISILFLSGVFIAVFGQSPADLKIMSLLCMLAGFFGNTIQWRGRRYYLRADGRFELKQ